MRAKSLQGFFPERYALRLDSCGTVEEIFELVRDAVKELVGVVRTGLDLGLAELEDHEGKAPGALHPLRCNYIIINRRAVELVRRERPELMRAFLFHSLLYEYLQTIGLVAEPGVKGRALEISLPLFGADHPVTRMAEDLRRELPCVTYSPRMCLPEGTQVSGFGAVDAYLA
ncbi:MAG: hypothetical protein LUQ39_04350 [Methanomassiliicoccales archaeon]|nr:hypothetical protein [Methanomassiliicoccales archaeon]